MGLSNLPLEIKSMIVELIPRRRDLAAWHRTCKDTQYVLRQYRNDLVQICKHPDGLDLTHPGICPSSPKIFRAWMRVESRHDDIIMEEGDKLFYSYYEKNDGESWGERETRKRDARLILRHIRDHIGNDHFMKFFKTSVQDGSSWALDVVSIFSEEDDEDDENDNNHELALQLTRAASETLKVHGRRLYEGETDRPPIGFEIQQWALSQNNILLQTNPLAAARFAKSMLDDALAQEVRRDRMVQFWADSCLGTYRSVFLWSIVESVDGGKFADSMLGTIQKSPVSPHVHGWADRCFSLYATFGMPVHAITFAQGMLEVLRPYGSDTADLSSKWKQRCLSQERKRALWKKAGCLAQAMLRAYLKCGSLPGLPQIPEEKQPENIAYDSQQLEPRLLKAAFPEELPGGLLNDAQAQAQILKAVTRATRDAKGRPIDGKKMIEQIQSAIRSWETDKSEIAIGAYQNR